MGKWRGASTPSLSMPLSPHHFTNLEALWTNPRPRRFGVFMEASIHRHNWLNCWPLAIDSTSSSSPLPRGQRGWGAWRGGALERKWKFPPSNHMVGFLSSQPSSFGYLGFSKSHLINITKDTFICSHHLRNSKGFRSSMLEMGTKTKYIFLSINHNITASHWDSHTGELSKHRRGVG